jgi:hypothetical protein
LENSYSPAAHNNNKKNPYIKSQDKLTIGNIMRKGKLTNTTQHFEIKAHNNESSTG